LALDIDQSVFRTSGHLVSLVMPTHSFSFLLLHKFGFLNTISQASSRYSGHLANYKSLQHLLPLFVFMLKELNSSLTQVWFFN